MWYTPEGSRVMTGAERELFRETLRRMVDHIEDCILDEDESRFGIKVFDPLTGEQKLALLLQVGRALLSRNVPFRGHTSLNESAVAAVYRHMEQLVRIEIRLARDIKRDGGDPYHFRRLLSEAAKQVLDYEEGGADDWTPPRHNSRDREEWGLVIDVLASSVLWDADYDLEEFFMDASPEWADFQRQRMGIDDDYFTDIPPDPTPEQMKKVRAGLRRLLTNHRR